MHAGDPSVVARRESSARSYSRWVTPVLGRAKGSLIWSRDGARHIDFLAGAGSLNYGHNDDDMKAALLDYISADGIAHGLDMTTEAKLGFLSAFEEHILRPRELDYHCQFTGPTGANAIEAAIKLARRVTGRSQVIAFTRAFHGVSAGALAATANSYFRGSGHGLHGVTRLPYDGYLGSVDTAQLLADMLADPASGIEAPAAILLETVQGEGGLASASNAWMRAVARIAREVGALLIVDDIQAGCGRSGRFFSFERAGIEPDLVCLSKSISGMGFPMGLLLIRPDLDQWAPGEDNGTFRGNCVAFVAAAEMLQRYWSDPAFEMALRAKEAVIRHAIVAIAGRHPQRVRGVRGIGLMQGLEFIDEADAAAVKARCWRERLLVETCGARDQVLKLMPALTIDRDALQQGLDTVAAAVDALDAAAAPQPTVTTARAQ